MITTLDIEMKVMFFAVSMNVKCEWIHDFVLTCLFRIKHQLGLPACLRVYQYILWHSVFTCFYFADTLDHLTGITHITVLSKGRYYKVYTHDHGKLLNPRDFERYASLLAWSCPRVYMYLMHLSGRTCSNKDCTSIKYYILCCCTTAVFISGDLERKRLL